MRLPWSRTGTGGAGRDLPEGTSGYEQAAIIQKIWYRPSCPGSHTAGARVHGRDGHSTHRREPAMASHNCSIGLDIPVRGAEKQSVR